jgi:hypothetical protein
MVYSALVAVRSLPTPSDGKVFDTRYGLMADTMDETRYVQFPDVAGFQYIPSFVPGDEEHAVEGLFRTLSYRQIIMRG